MSWLFNLAYLLASVVALPWLLYGAVRHGKYRTGYAEKLLGRVPALAGARPAAWFHAVSVGEVNLLQPLLERFSATFPGWDCVISATTKTGYELAQKKYAGHRVFYCPLDFSWAVETALRRIRPDLLVLAELELWPNLIGKARQQGCRVAIVNGRLSDRSFRGYRRLTWLFQPILAQIDLIAAQNEEYADRFRALIGSREAARVHVTGSVKFDGILTDRRNAATCRLRELAGIAADEVVFLAGSTQDPEEDLAIATFRELKDLHPKLRLVIVPRHTTRSNEIAECLEQSGLSWRRRTNLLGNGGESKSRVLLVDTIGELAAWWGTAQIAFVGGSMGSRGGQNMIEPAAFGSAVAFGPNTRNFRETVRLLLQCEGAVVVHSGQELTDFVRRCLDDPSAAAQMGRRAQQLVLTQQGAADRTMQALSRMLTPSVDPTATKAA